MKRTNKYLSLALAIIMALSLCVTSFAAGETADITIVPADGNVETAKETYKAYKIFDYTTGNATIPYPTTGNYAYTIVEKLDATTLNPWFAIVRDYTVGGTAVFTLTPSANDPNVNVVTFKTVDPVDFAAYLMRNVGTITPNATTETGKFEGLPLGYYFVDTTLGSLCSLVNAGTEQPLQEKNWEPTVEKKIIVNGAPVDATTASIGGIVNYQVTVSNATGTDQAITVHDVMESALTFKDDVVVKVGDTTATENTDYEVTTSDDDCTFEIVLKDAFVQGLADNAQVVITYSAELNNTAVVEEAHDNTVWITYAGQESAHDTVTVKTFNVGLIKTDKDGKKLEGATFKLYKATKETVEGKTVYTKTDVINLVAVTGGYAVADSTAEATVTDINVGEAVITGLGNGVYCFEETVAPNGYNKLTDVVGFEITDANHAQIAVENRAGGILPGTGGVGTTMFYVLGSVMMIGAAILLVTKKKMANEQ